MKTTVTIEDNLMARTLRVSSCKTKRSAIQAGLRLLVQLDAQKKLRRLKGKIAWQGDLEKTRRPAFEDRAHEPLIRFEDAARELKLRGRM